MDSRIQLTMSTIEKEFFRLDLNVDSLARAVSLSSSRFQHLFKVETGDTPTHYLKVTRLRAAEILLKTEFLSIKQIMNRAGFSHYSNFIHDFKKTHGVAPGKYRILSRS